MACKTIVVDGVAVGISCGHRNHKPCQACEKKPGDLLCDWKLSGAKAGATCDRRICRSCAREVGCDKHLCPAHAKMWDEHPANPANAKETGT